MRVIKAVVVLLAGLLMAGCVTTTKQNVNFKPTIAATLPEQVAIQYLRSLPANIDAGGCRYTAKGMAGRESLGVTRVLPYKDWHISGIGEFSSLAASGVAILIRADDAKTIYGKYCFSYYEKAVQLTPDREQMLNKAVTALVSLGVNYDPKSSREW